MASKVSWKISRYEEEYENNYKEEKKMAYKECNYHQTKPYIKPNCPVGQLDEIIPQ